MQMPSVYLNIFLYMPECEHLHFILIQIGTAVKTVVKDAILTVMGNKGGLILHLVMAMLMVLLSCTRLEHKG